MSLAVDLRNGHPGRGQQGVEVIWNARTGAPLPLAKPLQATINAETRVLNLLHEVALTLDLKHAASAISEGDPLPGDRASFRDDQWKYPNSQVDVIDLATGKVILSIANPDGEFGKLAISANGSNVATLTGKTVETPFKEEGLSIRSMGTVRRRRCASRSTRTDPARTRLWAGR